VSLAELLWLVAPPLCWGCEEPARGGEPLCRRCRAGLRWLGPSRVELDGVRTWAPVAYEGAAREIVRGLKFRGAAGLAEAMAAQVVAAAPGDLLTGVTLVPVPLPPARLRRRGFNQAERLARAIGRRAGLPLARCLERAGDGIPQVGRPRPARLSAVAGMVRTRRQAAVPERPLIVDDVVTTGATLAACAQALRRAGAHDITAVAYARTLAR
jgi:ComF family protein